MEVVRLMALLFAHINFQIRRGFRSRIFFELKIPFRSLTAYNALRCKQSAPTQSVRREAKNFPAWAVPSIREGWVKVTKAQPFFSNSDSHQKPISPNLNYI
jgi:hypothetical protein